MCACDDNVGSLVDATNDLDLGGPDSEASHMVSQPREGRETMQLREVDITPKVAEWARISAGFSKEEAAVRIGRPEEEIAAWESGELKPSMAQIRKACEVYKRPLAAFFLPEPPQDFAMLRDFRRLPADMPKEYSPNLRFLVRQTRTRQEWLSDFLQSDNHPPLEFVGSARSSDNSVRLAAQDTSRRSALPLMKSATAEHAKMPLSSGCLVRKPRAYWSFEQGTCAGRR